MTYVALLRGINVGGKNKVDMRLLKTTFERAGMEQVRTYINSGNVIFSHASPDAKQLVDTLEQAIEADFGFRVKVLLRDTASIAAMLDALPDDWANDESAKCDVMFLGDGEDSPAILGELTIKPEIDDVRYVPGALLWRVERPAVTRSGMMRLVGTEPYKQISPAILGELTIKPEIDDVRYVPGALLWRVERPAVTRSGMMRLVGTEPYKQMTVRNCNTLRKLGELIQQAEAEQDAT